MKRYISNPFVLTLMLAVFVAGCNNSETESGSDESRERIVAVGTMIANPIDFEDYIRINGTLAAHDDAMVSVETPGQVLYIADRGSRVNKGDIILRLDDRLLRANYEAAKSGYDLAEDVYRRQARLHADSVISTVQYLQSKSQRDQAAAQLAAIEKQLEDSNLRAPFSGRVEEKLTSTGAYVGPGTPVLRLVNTSRIRVTGGVPERYAGLIGNGSPVEIGFRNYDIPAKSGTVRFASNIINPDSRTFPVEVVLNNADGQMKPLMVTEMRVLRRKLDDQIVVPRTAIVRDEVGNSVFIVREENGQKRAVAREIQIAFSSGSFVVIQEGLDAGDEVIISGLTNLGDGDLLNITQTSDSKSLQASRVQ